MKYAHATIAITLLSLASTCNADNIPWVMDLREAQQQAAAQHRLVMVHFTAQSCGPCRQLERGVYSRPEFVRALLANYIPVKIDGPANPGLVQQFQVGGWPTDIFLTPDGAELFRDTSPQDMNQYISRVDKIAAHARAGISTAVAPAVQASGQHVQAMAHAAQQRIERASQFVPPQGPQNVVNQFTQNPLPGGNGVPMSAPHDQQRPAVPPQQSVAVTNPYVQGQMDAIRRRAEQAQATIPRPPFGGGNAIENRPAADHSQTATAGKKPPKLALDGFCPVGLLESKQWKLGNTQWGHIHRGKLYLFSSEEAKAKFWNDPDRYSPVMSGYDIVQFIEGQQLQDGARDFGLYYRNRYYLFSSAATRERFENTPDFYADKAHLAIAEHDRAVMRR